MGVCRSLFISVNLLRAEPTSLVDHSCSGLLFSFFFCWKVNSCSGLERIQQEVRIFEVFTSRYSCGIHLYSFGTVFTFRNLPDPSHNLLSRLLHMIIVPRLNLGSDLTSNQNPVPTWQNHPVPSCSTTFKLYF